FSTCLLSNSSIRNSGVFFLLQVAKLILQFAIFFILGFLEIFSNNYWYLGLIFFVMTIVWLSLFISENRKK
ncbi:hypothetical protein, partial [Lactovum miscens]|uniref:hypothetical protein n=1 Tax=Lactovum miscens TaxID=190387 RepID=UPI001C84A8B3